TMFFQHGSQQRVRSAPYAGNADLFAAQLLDGLDLRLGINPEHRAGEGREHDPQRRAAHNRQQARAAGAGEGHGASNQSLDGGGTAHDHQLDVETFVFIESRFFGIDEASSRYADGRNPHRHVAQLGFDRPQDCEQQYGTDRNYTSEFCMPHQSTFVDDRYSLLSP